MSWGGWFSEITQNVVNQTGDIANNIMTTLDPPDEDGAEVKSPRGEKDPRAALDRLSKEEDDLSLSSALTHVGTWSQSFMSSVLTSSEGDAEPDPNSVARNPQSDDSTPKPSDDVASDADAENDEEGASVIDYRGIGEAHHARTQEFGAVLADTTIEAIEAIGSLSTSAFSFLRGATSPPASEATAGASASPAPLHSSIHSESMAERTVRVQGGEPRDVNKSEGEGEGNGARDDVKRSSEVEGDVGETTKEEVGAKRKVDEERGGSGAEGVAAQPGRAKSTDEGPTAEGEPAKQAAGEVSDAHGEAGQQPVSAGEEATLADVDAPVAADLAADDGQATDEGKSARTPPQDLQTAEAAASVVDEVAVGGEGSAAGEAGRCDFGNDGADAESGAPHAGEDASVPVCSPKTFQEWWERSAGAACLAEVEAMSPSAGAPVDSAVLSLLTIGDDDDDDGDDDDDDDDDAFHDATDDESDNADNDGDGVDENSGCVGVQGGKYAVGRSLARKTQTAGAMKKLRKFAREQSEQFRRQIAFDVSDDPSVSKEAVASALRSMEEQFLEGLACVVGYTAEWLRSRATENDGAGVSGVDKASSMREFTLYVIDELENITSAFVEATQAIGEATQDRLQEIATDDSSAARETVLSETSDLCTKIYLESGAANTHLIRALAAMAVLF